MKKKNALILFSTRSPTLKTTKNKHKKHSFIPPSSLHIPINKHNVRVLFNLSESTILFLYYLNHALVYKIYFNRLLRSFYIYLIINIYTCNVDREHIFLSVAQLM